MAASNAIPGWGTIIAISAGGSPAIFTDVGEVVSMTLAVSRDVIEKTHLQSPGMAREFLAGMIDSGELAMELNLLPDDAAQTAIYADLIETTPANAVQTYRILWPTVGAVSVAFAVGDVDTINEEIDITGHDIKIAQQVRFTTTDTLPDPLVAGTIYWAGATGVDAVTVHTTEADAVADTNRVNFTNGGVGTHTMHYQAEVLFSAIPTNYEPSNAFDGKSDLTLTMKLTGVITSTV